MTKPGTKGIEPTSRQQTRRDNQPHKATETGFTITPRTDVHTAVPNPRLGRATTEKTT
jgi:hypothetical protein